MVKRRTILKPVKSVKPVEPVEPVKPVKPVKPTFPQTVLQHGVYGPPLVPRERERGHQRHAGTSVGVVGVAERHQLVQIRHGNVVVAQRIEPGGWGNRNGASLW